MTLDARLLDYAGELEARDSALAEAIDAVARVELAAAETRARAALVAGLLERLPAELAAAASACGCARAEIARRREDEAAAIEAASRARGGQKQAEAQRAVARAAAAVQGAERALAAAEAHRDRLAQELRAAELEVPLLEERAHTVAAELRALPRVSSGAKPDPGPGLAGVEEWGARARAALFVSRSGLETERERVVREANELVAATLGEIGGTTTVALARRRLEHAARPGSM